MYVTDRFYLLNRNWSEPHSGQTKEVKVGTTAVVATCELYCKCFSRCESVDIGFSVPEYEFSVEDENHVQIVFKSNNGIVLSML